MPPANFPKVSRVTYAICTTELGIDDMNQDLVHRDDQQDRARDGDRTIRQVHDVRGYSIYTHGAIPIESSGYA